MPSTPSLCCKPIEIYSSSGDESVQAGIFADDDNSYCLVHAVTPIQPECSSSICLTAGVGDLIDISSSIASSITSSTNLVCTDSSNTTTVPKPISYRGNSSSGSSHGSPKDIAQSPCFTPVQPINTQYSSTMFSNISRCFNPI